MPLTDISNKVLRIGQPRLSILNQASYMGHHYSCALLFYREINIFDLISLVPLHLCEPPQCTAKKDPPRREFALLATEARHDLFKFSLKAIQYILRHSQLRILKE